MCKPKRLTKLCIEKLNFTAVTLSTNTPHRCYGLRVQLRTLVFNSTFLWFRLIFGILLHFIFAGLELKGLTGAKRGLERFTNECRRKTKTRAIVLARKHVQTTCILLLVLLLVG